MDVLRKLAFLVLRTRRDVRNAALLFVLMVVAAALEAVGVGLVMPFVALIQNPRIADGSRALQGLRHLSGAQTDAGLVYAFGAALVGIFVFKSVYVSLVQWIQFRWIFGRQIALSRALVERYFGNDYTFHLRKNSADLVQNVILEIYLVIAHALVSVFVMAVEALTVLVIMAAMVAVEPLLVPIVGAVLAALALLFYRAVQKKSLALGERLNKSQAEMIKWLQQGLGGIKEAQVIGVERFFLDSFTSATIRFGRAAGQHQLIQVLPRYVLEALGVVALVAVSLGMLARGRGADAVLPVLGVLAVASVRLLPSTARIVASLTDLRHNTPAVSTIHSALTSKEKTRIPSASSVAPIRLERRLSLVDVEYRYPEASQPALRDLNLTIERGESVAFVGSSGAGKTTMADLLIGLLEPTKGRIEVDGEPLTGDRLVAWRRGIGYIPQQVYLCDDSILRNVAFGVEDSRIDRARVERAVDAARLRDLVDSLPEGLDTFVGERGVRLSGGQRQRIGIARALYLEPRVLVLDEATSALDGKTEQEIVDAIERIRSDRTAIIIAHRMSTVRNCDRLVLLKEGRIVQTGTWAELFAKSSDFRQLVNLADGDTQATDVA